MGSDKQHIVVGHWVMLHDQTWARVYLNDLLLYRSPYVGPDSRSGPANYLLVPGENELSIELLQTKKPLEGKHVQDALIVQLYTVNNLDAPETEALDRTVLVDLRFPQIWDAAPERFQRYPFYHRESFELELDLPEPVFAVAPKAEFGCSGTPELREAVERIYRLIETGDYEGLLDELSLKFQCGEQAYPGEDAQRAGVKMQQWREELFAYEPRPVEPLDLSLLHFEPRRGGSVADVTRHDDGYVIDAVCAKDPKRRIRTDLLMVQHQGRWRVFA